MRSRKSIPIIILFILIGMAISISASGCTLMDLFSASYSDISELKLRDVDIDEYR
jgi:hypothetical protein